jgi:hypothetical protein
MKKLQPSAVIKAGRRRAFPKRSGRERSDAVMAIDSEASSRRNWRRKWAVHLNGPLVLAHDTNWD